MISDRSRQALDAYDDLVAAYPGLVMGRTIRPIVLERSVREAYVETTGMQLGVVAENSYFFVVVDLVASNGCEPFAYSRIVQRKQLSGAPGVAILARIAEPRLGNVGDIVVIRQERHTTGRIELEIPRGFGEPGESSVEAAMRELAEETGYVGSAATQLGHIASDTGIQDGVVVLFAMDVVGRRRAAAEAREAIVEVALLSPQALASAVHEGYCRDSFTIAALAYLRLSE